MYNGKVILNVLCEGQTEAEFVKRVLVHHLQPFDIATKYQLLETSKKKKARGGLLSYQQARGDLMLWMKQVAHRDSEVHYFTTMFDLYALPKDFPSYSKVQHIQDIYSRIDKLESAFKQDIGSDRFIPYIQIYEFEALLFCNIEKLADKFRQCDREIKKLEKILDQYQGNPEYIDGGLDTAPSKRILKALEKSDTRYNKPQMGGELTAAIGMDTLKANCRHFSTWVEKLERLGDRNATTSI